MRSRFCVFIAAVILGLSVTAASGTEVATIARGRALFVKKCDPCHSLERSLEIREDRAGWAAVLRRMIIRGAKLDKPQIEPILTYLSAKSAFETKCNGCHELERPLTAIKTPEQWQQTVQRMAARKPGLLSSTDAEAVWLYLTLVTTVDPGAPASDEKR